MATVATDMDRDMAPAKVAGRDRFFFHVALFCLLIGVAGFAPTYWLQIYAGTAGVSPLVHLHAAVFTAWLTLLVSQAWLVSRGRLRNHRAWGLVGISLATLVVVIGLATGIAGLNDRLARGQGDAARAFFIVSVVPVVGFTSFFAAAMANINRPEWHKRLVLLATISLLAAAVARFLFLARNGMHPGLRPGALPPASPTGPSVQAALLLLGIVFVGMVRDVRRDGKVHPAWLWGVAGLLLLQGVKFVVPYTPTWMRFADLMASFQLWIDIPDRPLSTAIADIRSGMWQSFPMQPASPILEELLERVRSAQLAFVSGDSAPYEGLFEHSDDATLTGPFGGPTICGWDEIQPRMRRAASFFQGSAERSEVLLQSATVGTDLIVLRLAEHNRVRFEGRDEVVNWDLRVTLVFRNKVDGWLVLHRHADPLAELTPAVLPQR